MAPRKRTASKQGEGPKAPKARGNSKKEKNKKLAVFLADFDKQCKIRILEIERQGKNLCKQIETFYGQEIIKIPKATRQMKFEDYLAMQGNSATASLGKIEEDINKAIQLPQPRKPPKGCTPTVPKEIPAQMHPTPLAAAASKQPLGTGTVCRKAIPNEILWSAQGSPVIVDPRAALAQRNVQATIAVKKGALAVTTSPLSDTEKCPRLEAADIEAINKLQEKLTKMVEINKKGAVKAQNVPSSVSSSNHA